MKVRVYLIKVYGYLVKTNTYDLEPVEGSTKKSVPEEYRIYVAQFLADGTLPEADITLPTA